MMAKGHRLINKEAGLNVVLDWKPCHLWLRMVSGNEPKGAKGTLGRIVSAFSARDILNLGNAIDLPRAVHEGDVSIGRFRPQRPEA
jgi:hypothetical protein